MNVRTPWILLGLAGASLLLVHTVLTAVAAGVLWAILAWPVYRAARKQLRPRPAALATLATTALAAFLPLGLLAPLVLRDLQALGPLDALWASAPTWTSPVQGKLDDLLHLLQGRLEAAAGQAFLQAPIAAFVAYAGLRQGGRVTLHLARTLPLRRSQAVVLLYKAAHSARAVAAGQLLIALLKGTAGGIGLWLAGVPHAVLLGAVMAAFTLLPVLTAWMVWLPAALWLAGQGHIVAAVFLAAWGVLVVGLTDNLLRPLLVGKQARMHPVVALVGMAGGVATLGLPGLVLGPVLLDFTLGAHDAWQSRHPKPTPAGERRPRPTRPHRALAPVPTPRRNPALAHALPVDS